MKYTAALFLLLVIPAIGLASSPLPWIAYCKALDQAVTIAVSQSQTSRTALDVLELVAMGRMAEISAESAAKVGLPTDHLSDPGFSDPDLRGCAFRKIAATGLSEAEAFLRDLKRADVRTDDSLYIWAQSQVALRDARFRRIADPQLKIEFLETTLMEPEMSRDPVGHWAVDQLCDRGALGSLVVIQEAVRKRRNGQRDEDEIAFCEARIRVLYGKPDPVKALGSVLSLNRGAEDTRLTSWAIQQLVSMHSQTADAELDRFASEIARLPTQSPDRGRFLHFREEIQLDRWANLIL
jgi:hypothetical protein